MKTLEKRQIESFELSKDYYVESWINGNKNHVAQELSELLICSLAVGMVKILELPKEAQKFVLNSEWFKIANNQMSYKQLVNID